MVETYSTGKNQEGSDSLRKGLSEESSKQIISSLSHELRTPLSIISSNLQLLEKSNEQMDENIRKESFEICGEAIKSMSRFLDDVYFLNVSLKGELSLNREQINLSSFFQTLIKEFTVFEFDQDRLNLYMNLNSEFIYSDRELISRAIRNVISNALKFSPENVSVNVIFNDQQLVVEISDKGIGIPSDELDFIMDPFFRASNVKLIAGTGLGLSIVKKTIDSLKGEVFVDSIVEEGTNVKLIIPNEGR